MIARQVKHIFTGDLNAAVDTNPKFPGKERHLLRAQLARIFAATALSPKGLFVMEDPDEEGASTEPKFAEEYTIPGTEELKNLDQWTNLHPMIAMSGVTKHVAPEHITDLEERKTWEDEKGLTDKIIPRFEQALQDHVKVPGYETAWTSKIVGDVQPFTQVAPKEGTVSYGVNVIRSLRWPGAVTVAKGGKFTSIYVGYGLKRGGQSQMPAAPEDVVADPEEPKEMPEPFPLEEPPAQDPNAAEANSQGS